MTNIINDLTQHAVEQPDAPLYIFLNGRGHIIDSYSYGSFDQRTNALARGLLDSGKLAAGDHVLLVYPPRP